jgi:predicted permease
VSRATRRDPPALAVAALARLLGAAGRRDEALGDLCEEFARRAASSDPRRARVWFWREAGALALRLAPRAALRLAGDRLLGRRSSRPAKESSMSQLTLDLKLAGRSLRRHAGTTALAVATLAVALGVNAAIFGVVDALVLRPFSFPEVDRLAMLSETADDGRIDSTNVAPANYLDWRAAASGAIDDLAAYAWWDVNLTGDGGPERAQGYRVTPGFFAALRVAPELGRFPLAAEGELGSEQRVVLGHSIWKRRYGGDPGIVGRTVRIGGEAYDVVGVAPEGFDFPGAAEVWAPLAFSAEQAADRESHYLGVFGRLAPGVALPAARARFSAAAERLALAHPTTNAGRGVATRTLALAMLDPGTPPILALFQVGALFVLLLGWLNVANLILARGSERRRELAVLDALGAGRRRVVRLLLLEGGILAALAALGAMPVAALAIRAMREGLPPEIAGFVAGWRDMGFDLATLGFTFGLASLSLLAVSMVPALRATRGGGAGALHEGSHGGTAGRSAQRGRNVLVVAEVALGLLLVVAAGICVRGAGRMLDGPQGYDSERLLTLRLVLPRAAFADDAARRAFARTALDRLAAIPGVEAVAAANTLPNAGGNWSLPITLEGGPEPDPASAPTVDLRFVTPGFFDTLRLPLLSGRAPAAADDEHAARVAVVSRSLAERYWPGLDPIGRRFRFGGAGEPWTTVIGVAGDHIHHWFDRRDYPTLFASWAQSPQREMAFALRTRGEPEALAATVERAFAGFAPDQPVFDVRSQRRAIRATSIGLVYIASIMAAFGGLALLLAISGVYGVMAYRVGLRRREIGVRVALGATDRDIVRLTLGQAWRLTLVGLALGIGLALVCARAISAVVRGTSALDFRLAAVAVALLAGAATLAALVPARRALALDPADVLRSE